MLYRISALLSSTVLGTAMLAWHPPAASANNYPIVMVHGFLGFGPEQYTRTGFKYWGGFDDIVSHMRSHHGEHQVWAASVGSISSNWDRAAELYYQIKGGCVDYGSSHTARFARFGALQQPEGKCWAADALNNPNNYPLALYPVWDAQHPVHLIAHSQGGQTVRALIELLENGSPHGDEGGGDLYQGGRIGWVLSASTLSAPHDGTSLRDAIGYFPAAVNDLAGAIAAMANRGERTTGGAPVHDFRLEKFGVTHYQDETAASYRDRVLSAPIWDQENYDSAQHEMGPDGAQEFNAWVKTSPHVYYFSASNSATAAGAICCNQTDRLIAPIQSSRYQYPRRDMAPLTKPYAGEWIVPFNGRRGIGSYTQTKPGQVKVDSSWFRNDGVVNTRSMRSPLGQPVRDYDGKAVKGMWNYLQHYDGYDHFDMIGWPRSGTRAYPIYDSIQQIVYGL